MCHRMAAVLWTRDVSSWPQVYAPSRTVVVYAPADCCDAEADSKPAGIPGLGVKGLGACPSGLAAFS